jgi:hypothetical protein
MDNRHCKNFPLNKGVAVQDKQEASDSSLITGVLVKSLARPTSLSVVFSVHGTGGSPTGPDPENRVGDQDTGSPGSPVSSKLKCPVSRFLPGRARDLSAPR